MPDSTENVTVTVGQWVDLYAITGLSVGTQISVENIGSSDIYLTVLATLPTPDYDKYDVVRAGGLPAKNTAGDSGAWAYSPNREGKLSVRAM